MHQTQYVENLLQEYEDCMEKGKRTPMTPTVILGTPESEETEHYHDLKSLIGKLLFLASRTRPDILHATILMCQYSNYPNESHLEELYNILNYLKQNPERKINMSKINNESLSTCRCKLAVIHI